MQTLKLGEAASGVGPIQMTHDRHHCDEGKGARSTRPGAPHYGITRFTTLQEVATASFLPTTQPKEAPTATVCACVSGAQLGQPLSHSVLFENTQNYKRQPRGQKAERLCERKGRAAVSNLTSSTLKIECTFPVFPSYPLPPDRTQSMTLL